MAVASPNDGESIYYNNQQPLQQQQQQQQHQIQQQDYSAMGEPTTSAVNLVRNHINTSAESAVVVGGFSNTNTAGSRGGTATRVTANSTGIIHGGCMGPTSGDSNTSTTTLQNTSGVATAGGVVGSGLGGSSYQIGTGWEEFCDRHARAAATDFAKSCINYINTNLIDDARIISHKNFMQKFLDSFGECFEVEFTRRRNNLKVGSMSVL